MQEENVFVQSEQESQRPPGNGKNCHGHFRSIQAGGHGHWQGDSCGCDGQPSTPINMYVPILLLVALIIILKIQKRKKQWK